MHLRGWALASVAWAALAWGCSEGSPVASPLRVDTPRALLLGRVGEPVRVSVQLENTGAQAVRIVRAEVGETLRGEVRLVGVPELVPGRAFRRFEVVMVPSAPGVRGDVARLVPAEGSPVELELRAIITGPILEAFPSQVDLGAVAVGDQRGTDVTLRLRGGEAIELATATVRGAAGYRVEAGFPRRLVPGGRATLRVSFAPIAAGEAPAELVLGAGGVGLPPIPLHAVGIDTDVVLDPERAELGAVLVGERREHRLRVVSRARVDHRISLSATGATGAFEGLEALSATVTLEAGAELEHPVALAPLAVGTASITVWARIDGGARRAIGVVVGEGVADPARAFRVDPPVSALGPLEIGHPAVVSVWLVNDAIVPVAATGTAAVTSGAAASIVAAAPVPALLPAHDRHRFLLRVTPERAGAGRAELALYGARATVTYEGVPRPVANLAGPTAMELGALLDGPGLAERTVSLERTGRLDAVPTATLTGPGARWLRVTATRTTSAAIEVDLRGRPGAVADAIRARLRVTLPDGVADVPLSGTIDRQHADLFAVCVTGPGAELHLVPQGSAPWDAPAAASSCAPGGAGGGWAIGRVDANQMCAAADGRGEPDVVMVVVTTPPGAPAARVQISVGGVEVAARAMAGGRRWNVAWLSRSGLLILDEPGWDAGPPGCR